MYNLDKLLLYKIHCHYESNHTKGIYSISTIKRHFVNDNMLDVENCQNISQAFLKKRRNYFSRVLLPEKKKISADLSTCDKLFSDNIYTFQSQKIIDLARKIIDFVEIKKDAKLYARILCDK